MSETSELSGTSETSETSDPKPPVRKPRITVLETLYHQGVLGEKPTTVECQFERELESDEQPYQRRCKVGEDPQPLDVGWIEEVGEIHIQNNEGRSLQVQPTEEEKAETAKKSLSLGIQILKHDQDGRYFYRLLEIPAGESTRLNFNTATEWFICSEHETTRFTITVFPR